MITHTISEDGLSMTSVATDHPMGVLRATVGWPDLETAQAHYETAKRIFDDQIIKTTTVSVGEVRRSRVFRTRVGSFVTTYSVGPPTWWAPNLKFFRDALSDGRSFYELRAGWLRVCGQLTWVPGKRRT